MSGILQPFPNEIFDRSFEALPYIDLSWQWNKKKLRIERKNVGRRRSGRSSSARQYANLSPLFSGVTVLLRSLMG